MNTNRAHLLPFCAALLLILSGQHSRADDLAALRRQMIAFELASVKGGQTQTWATDLMEDGSWPDVDYTDQSRGNWKTSIHLKRAVALAAAYVREKLAGREDAGLKSSALSAAHYWINRDFQNPNWWQNEINVPRDIATILLLIGDDMSAEDKAAALKIANRAAISMTGQNRVWKSGIVFERALVQGDEALAHQARDAILAELVVTGSEGLQADYSFHQHGPQQQFGNYGLSFANDMAAWAAVWQGTSLAFSSDKMELLCNYVLNGEAVVTANGNMDISSCDRQLGPGSPGVKGRSVLDLLKKMEQLAPARAPEFRAAVTADSRPVGAGNEPQNVNFFRSDYMVHRRPGFFASVKLCSNRVIGEETVNAENVSSRYLADGATFVYQSAKEYEDIFPVWDWRRIPGVTCPTSGTTLLPEGRMATDYAGGVSDGVYGAEGLDLRRDGVTGKKGWFFFDRGVVCLGAGISGSGGTPRTSVDQRLDLIGQGETATPQKGSSPAVTWLLNGGMGYLIFLQGAESVAAQTQPQMGSWKNVYSAGSMAAVSKEVFSTWITNDPGHPDYAYCMLPGATAQQLQLETLTSGKGIGIISNTPEVQAVRDYMAGITEILFYKAGSVKPGGVLVAASGPCAVLLGNKSIYAADPTQKEPGVTLTVGAGTVRVQFPTGALAGSSVRVRVD